MRFRCSVPRLTASLMLVIAVLSTSEVESVQHIFSLSSEHWIEGNVGAFCMNWRAVMPAPSFLTPEVRVSSSVYMDWSAGGGYTYALHSAYLLLMIEPPRDHRAVPSMGFGTGAHVLLYDAPGYRDPHLQTSPETPPVPPGRVVHAHRERAIACGRIHLVGGVDVKLSSKLVANGEFRSGIPRDPRFEVVAVGVGLMVGK